MKRPFLFPSFIVASLLLTLPAASAHAQVSVAVGIPSIEIGINVVTYPELVPVPGYPVYYDPRASSNYFFYDGLYWVYRGDNWYESSWYDGPWQVVGPDNVPLFVLRVPVRYYRYPPVYFRGWLSDAPPRWGEHWGRGWGERRAGWDRWDRRSAPRAAPLPVYQRQFSGNHYPRAAEQQHAIRSENYRYQPREAVTQQHFQQTGNSRNARPEPQRQADVRQRPTQAQPAEQRPSQVQPVRQRPQTRPVQHGPAQEQPLQQPSQVQHENKREERGPDRR